MSRSRAIGRWSCIKVFLCVRFVLRLGRNCFVHAAVPHKIMIEPSLFMCTFFWCGYAATIFVHAAFAAQSRCCDIVKFGYDIMDHDGATHETTRVIVSEGLGVTFTSQYMSTSTHKCRHCRQMYIPKASRRGLVSRMIILTCSNLPPALPPLVTSAM